MAWSWCRGWDLVGAGVASGFYLRPNRRRQQSQLWRKTGGTLACWGWNQYAQATPPGGLFKQVSGGTDYTCGIKTDGTLACWGTNTDGQTVCPAGTFSQVSAGGFHACGVRTDGTVSCWGLNTSGQAVPPAGAFAQVSAGDFHTCGLRTNGTLTCWGANGFGQASALTLSPISLAEGAIGQTYSQTINATGGAAPYTFAFTAEVSPRVCR